MKNIILLILFFIIFTSPVLAVNLQSSSGFLSTAAGKAGFDVAATPESIIAKVINAVLSLLGVVFLVLMVYGGFMWMTARGNDQQIEKAKGIITAAIIGVVVVVSAYAITYFVVSQIGGATLQ